MSNFSISINDKDKKKSNSKIELFKNIIEVISDSDDNLAFKFDQSEDRISMIGISYNHNNSIDNSSQNTLFCFQENYFDEIDVNKKILDQNKIYFIDNKVLKNCLKKSKNKSLKICDIKDGSLLGIYIEESDSVIDTTEIVLKDYIGENENPFRVPSMDSTYVKIKHDGSHFYQMISKFNDLGLMEITFEFIQNSREKATLILKGRDSHNNSKNISIKLDKDNFTLENTKKNTLYHFESKYQLNLIEKTKNCKKFCENITIFLCKEGNNIQIVHKFKNENIILQTSCCSISESNITNFSSFEDNDTIESDSEDDEIGD